MYRSGNYMLYIKYFARASGNNGTEHLCRASRPCIDWMGLNALLQLLRLQDTCIYVPILQAGLGTKRFPHSQITNNLPKCLALIN